MKSMRVFSFIVLGLIALAALSGCGGSSGSGSVSSFSQLPDASAMVSTSTSSTSLSRATVSGTAPLITALKASADVYFWNGLVATINTAGTATGAQARQFWGQVSGGPSGQGGCMMAQNTGQVFGRLLESATSSCYMKNMPNAASGVTVTPTPSGGNSHLFDQEAADKLVKVTISGMPSEGDHGGPGTVFIKVFGSNSVTSDVYKARLHFCGDSEVNGYETYEVNKSTLAYSSSSVHQDSLTAKFTSSLSATLKAGSGDELTFDPSEDRVITMKGEFSNDSFAAKITITGDNLIHSLMNHANGGGGGGPSFSDKISSVAEFSGEDMNSLRFLAAGFNGLQTASGGGLGGAFSHNFQGALEWQDTYYASIDTSASSLYTAATAVDLTTDSFFSESKTPSVDFTGLSCDETADYEVTMDFSDSNVAAIKTTCEADHQVKGGDNNYCWGGAVETAQRIVQEQCRTGGCN